MSGPGFNLMSHSQRSLILASASPRRRELVSFLGLDVTAIASDVDETFDDGVPPEEMVVELAVRKASQVARDHPDAIVLGADTTVVCNGQILNKPEMVEDAERMLRLLRGLEHLVHTGLAVVGAGDVATSVTTSVVRLRAISDDALRAYLATGESFD